MVTIKNSKNGWVVMVGGVAYCDPQPLSVARVIARNARRDIKRGVQP